MLSLLCWVQQGHSSDQGIPAIKGIHGLVGDTIKQLQNMWDLPCRGKQASTGAQAKETQLDQLTTYFMCEVPEINAQDNV